MNESSPRRSADQFDPLAPPPPTLDASPANPAQASPVQGAPVGPETSRAAPAPTVTYAHDRAPPTLEPPAATLDRTLDMPVADRATNGSTDLPVVPGYELLRPLGRGGMGVVYLARHQSLKRLVALKMILGAARDDAEERARFRAEAESAARLRHPHLVQVYEIGEANGLPFCALEFVPGGSLAQRLAAGPLPPLDAARLVARLAAAAQCAHDAGVVHRDLKPANILLDSDGSPKIADFGLAKRLDDRSALTQAGTILGTPSYMAPEQAEAKADEIGPAADIYSLGAILYELLVGRPPFRGPTVLDTLRQVREDEPAPPGRLQPGLPRDLETICLKCLEKNVRRRYVSASELAADLQRFLEGRPVAARATGRLERLWKWARREPWLAGLSGLLICVTLGALAIVSWQLSVAMRSARELATALDDRSQALTAQIKATANERTAAARERTATAEAREQTRLKELELDRAARSLYLHTIVGADREWRQGDVGGAERWLESSAPERRDWEWRFLRRQTSHRQLQYTDNRLGRTVQFRADGRLLAIGLDDGSMQPGTPSDVHLWDREAGRPRAVVSGFLSAFSPDGRFVAVARWVDKSPRSVVDLLDVDTGRTLRTFTGELLFAAALAFTPDSRQLVGADRAGTIVRWEVESGAVAECFADPARRVPPARTLSLYGPVALRADGSRAIFASGGLVDAQDGRTIARLKPFAVARFSPDGTRLAILPGGAGPDSQRLLIVDAEDGKTLHELPLLRQNSPHFTPVSTLQFSPDGRQLGAAVGLAGLALSFLGEAVVWDVATGEERLRVAPGSQTVLALDFSPDGRTLATGGETGEVQLHDIAGKRRERTFRTGARRAIVDLTFAPDGQTIAACHCSTGGTMLQANAETTVWKVEPPVEALRLAMPPPEPGSNDATVGYNVVTRSVRLRFSDDGKRIVWNGLNEQGLQRRSVRTTAPDAGSQADASSVEFAEADDPDVAASLGAFAVVDRVRDPKTLVESPGRLVVRAAGDRPEIELLKEGEWHVWLGATTPDGRTLVALLSNVLARRHDSPPGFAVKVWSTDDGRERFTTLDPSRIPGAVAISADGSRIAVVHHHRRDPSRLDLWDVASGARLRSLPAERTSHLAGFSRDGRRLALGDFRGPITTWDLDDPTSLLGVSMAGHLGRVQAMSFSPNGRRLASVGEDLVVRLWDTFTGQPVLELPGTGDLLQNVEFSPDGSRLAANDRAGRLRVWDGTAPPVPEFTSWPPVAAELDRQIAAGRDDLEVWKLRTAWHVRQVDWSAATDTQTKAAAHAPSDPKLWSDLALYAARARRWGVVRQAHDRLLELDRDRVDSWMGRAEAALRTVDFRSAAHDAEEAERRAGGDLELKCTLGGLLLLAGRDDDYRRLVERTKAQAESSGWIGPRHPNATRNRYLLARLAAYAERPPLDAAEAVAWAELADAAQPKAPWQLHALGAARYRAGRWVEAAAATGASMTVDPGWVPDANRLLAALIDLRLDPADPARRQALGAAVGQARSSGIGVAVSTPVDSPLLHPHDLIGVLLLLREAEREYGTGGGSVESTSGAAARRP